MTDVVAFFVVVSMDSVLKGEKSSLGDGKGKSFCVRIHLYLKGLRECFCFMWLAHQTICQCINR